MQSRSRTPPRPLTPAFERGVGYVRNGMDVVSAATLVGVTIAALRSACLKAKVFVTQDIGALKRMRLRNAKRDANIVKRWLDLEPLEVICGVVGVSATHVKRVLARELDIHIDIPTRPRALPKRGLTVKQQQGHIAAREILRRRADGEKVVVAQIARQHNVRRHTVEEALKRIHETPLDDSPVVSDTTAEQGDAT